MSMNAKSAVDLKDYFQKLDNRYASFKSEMENFVGTQLENMTKLNKSYKIIFLDNKGNTILLNGIVS